jgi:hypothetical protein
MLSTKIVLIHEREQTVVVQIMSYRGILNIRYVRQPNTGAKTFTKWIENQDDLIWSADQFAKAAKDSNVSFFHNRGLGFIASSEKAASPNSCPFFRYRSDDPADFYSYRLNPAYTIPDWLVSKMSNPFVKHGHRNAPEVKTAFRNLTEDEFRIIQSGGRIVRSLSQEISGVSAEEYLKQLQEAYAEDSEWGIF